MTRPLKNLGEICVIGGGMAGLSAAAHAASLGRLVTLFEGSGLYGGQLATVGQVDGLPLPDKPSGQDIAMALHDKLRTQGVRLVETEINTLEIGHPLQLHACDGSGAKQVYPAQAVIVASGGRLRKLGVPGEDRLAGRGVSRCASCDGGFYRNKTVAVIGGGDAAVHEALTLAPIVKEVVMVCRSPLRAKAAHVDRLSSRHNVRFVWDSEVVSIDGDKSVESLMIRDRRHGSTHTLPVSGVFPFIGMTPATEYLPDRLTDPDGLVETGPGLASLTDSRLFAAGAARSGFGGTVIEALAEGIAAAAAAHQLLLASAVGNLHAREEEVSDHGRND